MKLTQQKFYPWLLVVCYSLLGIFCPAAVTQFSMVVGELAEALGVETQTVLLADTCRAVCLVIAMFLSSWAYLRLGLRGTIGLGLLFQALPQFLIPLAVDLESLPVFFACKAAQGLNAMAFPLYISTITMWIDRRYAALSTAIFNGSFAAGSGVGAWVAGLLVPALGWRASFYAIGVMVAVLAVPVLLFTRDKPPAPAQETTTPVRQSGGYGSILRQPVTWLLVLALLANTWVTQAITVDMSVYASSIGYSYGETGSLMLVISVITVVSSILAGGVSDFLADRTVRKVRSRSLVMGAGYVLSAVGAALLPFAAPAGYLPLLLSSCAMMFGASWAAGVFWALPSQLYRPEDNVAGTAFCSGASNIPNPIAPMVVGVMLGTQGYWTAAWMTCAAASAISLLASILLSGKGREEG